MIFFLILFFFWNNFITKDSFVFLRFAVLMDALTRWMTCFSSFFFFAWTVQLFVRSVDIDLVFSFVVGREY